MAVSIRPVWLCRPYPPPDGTGHKNPGGRNRTSDFPDISRVHSPLYYARGKHSGWNSNPQLLLRRQVISPVNRPEYEQGLPGSNRRLRFWRPLCFRLHQAPLNIPDRIRTCTAGTGIRYGHPFHHGEFMVTPNRMLKARRLSTEGSASPRNHLYTFDLSLIPSISLILSAEYPFSLAIVFMFFPVLTRLITGKLIVLSSILFIIFSKRKTACP